MMMTPLPKNLIRSALRRHRHAFSLVEVTLALGIVTFGLVSVVGVLPTALNSGRQSFDQNRAAAIANTLFTSFRSQPFNKVCYVDAQFNDDGYKLSGNGPAPLDLKTPPTGSNSPVFYAKFLNFSTDKITPTGVDGGDAFGVQRRLSFLTSPPKEGADYKVALNFYDNPPSNQPDGMVATDMACRVELVISPTTRPSDQYRFVSTVAKRYN